MRAVAPGDVGRLAASMREVDVDEMLASSGPDIEASLHRSVDCSLHAWSVDHDGELVAMFGFAPYTLLGRRAAPWCLATPGLSRIPGMLTRIARRYCAAVREVYPDLVNHVDARNTPSIRWLKRIGFTVDQEAAPFGRAGLPFHRFEMKG